MRQVFWLVPLFLAFPHPKLGAVAEVKNNFLNTYSYGDSSRFTLDSLLIPQNTEETKCKANV